MPLPGSEHNTGAFLGVTGGIWVTGLEGNSPVNLFGSLQSLNMGFPRKTVDGPL